jgi:hypothetical protein
VGTYEPSSQNGPGGLTGTVLSDRYRLEEQIGSGGMGTVWKATDTLLNRPVAVKLLHRGFAGDERVSRRFQHEAQAAASLAQACAPHGLPLIHLSSYRVFGGGNKSIHSEKDIPAPLEGAGQAFLADEHHDRELRIPPAGVAE